MKKIRLEIQWFFARRAALRVVRRVHQDGLSEAWLMWRLKQWAEEAGWSESKIAEAVKVWESVTAGSARR